MPEEGNGEDSPEESFGMGTPRDLPSIKFLGEYFGTEYFDYRGRVEWRQGFAGTTPLEKYLILVDRKTGEQLCEISKSHENEFTDYVGRGVSFRGKLEHGVVIPHNK